MVLCIPVTSYWLMEWSLIFFLMKFACWEICMKYSFWFKSHCQIATLCQGDTLRIQWIEDVRKQTHIFPPLFKHGIWLLTFTYCYWESLWVTGLWLFNMISFLALKLTFSLIVLICRFLTQCIPLGLICVFLCVHAAPKLYPFLLWLYNCSLKAVY